MPNSVHDMQLAGDLVPVAEIDDRRRRQMQALMEAYYENVTADSFNTDLDRKDWVIQIIDRRSDEVVGFSTQVVIHTRVAGRELHALFSGDTIVADAQRGQRKLFQVSGWMLRRLIEQHGQQDLFWFLTSKGYKTYRFLPLFFHEFYPRLATPVPARYQAIIDALAGQLDAARYDPARGVLRAEAYGCRLRPGAADLTADRLRDPDIGFFAAANPGAAEGDELCCLAPLTLANFTPAAFRAMGPVPPAHVAQRVARLS